MTAGPGNGNAGDELTHIDADGRPHMVDVGAKDVTDRTARASCRIVMSAETAGRLAASDLPKGDPLTVARIAGIQAAKRTHELIPFCHPVRLVGTDVDVDVDEAAGQVTVSATVHARDRTGVEMEALTAAVVAALTVYDMVKAVERDARIADVRLDEKTGGARGDWRRPPN